MLGTANIGYIIANGRVYVSPPRSRAIQSFPDRLIEPGFTSTRRVLDRSTG